MSDHLLFDSKFLTRLGAFYDTWSSLDATIDLGIKKFLNITNEEAHLVTAAMEFGRKITLLRGLIARSSHKQKEKMIKALNAIQNESKRNTFSHSYIQSSKDKVFFVERSPHGKFTATMHEFTLPEFQKHLEAFTHHAKDLHDGLAVTQPELDEFCNAALKM